jgi:hypothetical protein
MGWSNFIVVPSMKLAVEVSRSIDEDCVEQYSKVIGRLFDEDGSIGEVLERTLNKLTTKQVAEIVDKAVTADSLVGLYYDNLFPVWLKLRHITFQIVNEFDFEKLDTKGMKIIRQE